MYVQALIEGLRVNRVMVVCGDTGCGKSTQVPQMILSHPELGKNAKIVVTQVNLSLSCALHFVVCDCGIAGCCFAVYLACAQPRRISAISLAERVAFERCEEIGGTVGYFIRLDSQVSSSTRLLFCTTGILLRQLTVNPLLPGVNVIILDEVHERDMYAYHITSFSGCVDRFMWILCCPTATRTSC